MKSTRPSLTVLAVMMSAVRPDERRRCDWVREHEQPLPVDQRCARGRNRRRSDRRRPRALRRPQRHRRGRSRGREPHRRALPLSDQDRQAGHTEVGAWGGGDRHRRRRRDLHRHGVRHHHHQEQHLRERPVRELRLPELVGRPRGRPRQFLGRGERSGASRRSRRASSR